MAWIQMQKIYASPHHMLDAGKFYQINDEAFLKGLLDDNACIIVREKDLPKTGKEKRRFMPSHVPDPESEAAGSKPIGKKPEDDEDKLDIDEDDEDA